MVSQTVYFTGMVVFTLTSQIMRCTIEHQYLCQYSYKYLSICTKYKYNYFGTHEYEYSTWTRNSVLEYEYRVWVPQPCRPPFGNQILNNSWAIGLTEWIIYNFICVFWHMQLYNKNPCAWLLWHWSSRGQLALSGFYVQLTEWRSVSQKPFKMGFCFYPTLKK